MSQHSGTYNIEKCYSGTPNTSLRRVMPMGKYSYKYLKTMFSITLTTFKDWNNYLEQESVAGKKINGDRSPGRCDSH